MKKHSFLTIVLASLCFTSIAHASIIIQDTTIRSRVSEGSGSGSYSTAFTGTTIPTSFLLTQQRGAVISNTQIDFSEIGGLTELAFGLNHVRTGASGSYAQSFVPPTTVSDAIQFRALSNEAYELSGNYMVDDFSLLQGTVSLFVGLKDLTANQVLFSNRQTSMNTVDESFELGLSGGDDSNELLGSLTGSLVAGHYYELSFNAITLQNQHASNASASATATGDISLKIGNVAPVPEPTTAVSWSMFAGCGLVAWRRRVAKVD